MAYFCGMGIFFDPIQPHISTNKQNKKKWLKLTLPSLQVNNKLIEQIKRLF